MRKSLSFALLALFTLGSQAATYYKWTDPNGVPHYSQNLPTNGVNLHTVKVINTRELGTPSTTNSGSNSSAAPVANSAESMTPEQRRIADLEAQNKAQQSQQNQERCKSLQNNLQNLNVGGRVYEMDKNGERKYLDGREIELRRQSVSKAISQYCNK